MFENKSDLNKSLLHEGKNKKRNVLDAMQLDYRTAATLSQTSA